MKKLVASPFHFPALQERPDWYVLDYNGPYSSLTVDNRATVGAHYAYLRPLAPAGYHLDEYPFASTAEGGWPSAMGKMVPPLENLAQGGYLSAFYRFQLKGLPLPFLVVPVPI